MKRYNRTPSPRARAIALTRRADAAREVQALALFSVLCGVGAWLLSL